MVLSSLRILIVAYQSTGIIHGDIKPENVLVSAFGKLGNGQGIR